LRNRPTCLTILFAASPEPSDKVIEDEINQTTIKEDVMKRLTTALLLQVAMLITLVAPYAVAQDGNRQPPVAKKVPHETKIHGYTLKDDYFWLREKKNPEVIKYMEDENAYTEEVMRPTKEFQDALYKEMLGHIKQTDLSVPSRIGDYYYY